MHWQSIVMHFQLILSRQFPSLSQAGLRLTGERDIRQKQRSGFRLSAPRSACLRPAQSRPQVPSESRSFASAQDFACRLPVSFASSRLQIGSKCNEALSRDLWPLDPFESAPMRATSSGMGYCILCAIPLPMEIKELAELLREKAGSNSLPLKKLLCESC
jgi:hypothetical protein